jgi:auxin-responsive protein IAA
MVNWFQRIGWPLVRAYRRNTFQATVAVKKGEKLFLKVRIDGVPYISKVTLRMYKGYLEFREALDLLFSAQSF